MRSRWKFANALPGTIIPPFEPPAKTGEGALSISPCVAHVNRVYLYPERRGCSLDGAELADTGGLTRITENRRSGHPRCDLLDLAGIGSGHRVLDVAAGTGEQTLMAARRVGPAAWSSR